MTAFDQFGGVRRLVDFGRRRIWKQTMPLVDSTGW